MRRMSAYQRRICRKAVIQRDCQDLDFNGERIILCKYCGERLSIKSMTLDHVVPKASGGRDKVENLVISCARCNTRKGTLNDPR